MAKKLLFSIFIALVSLQIATAQSAINGQVRSANGNVLKGATIMLMNADGNVLIKASIADTKGNYSFEQLQPGNYVVGASFVGYENTISATFSVNAGQNIIIPVLIIKTSEKKLQDVLVTGTYQKPMFEVKPDKTVFNVESSINATGSNAFELLQKSPGVTTDKDDNISMKAKSGVRVYIDGRPSQLNKADLATYLRSINSMDIESIELISNPSARYDASGNAGIINIKFKKNKKSGLNGSAAAGLNFGKTVKFAKAVSLNYRNKNINLFSNYSNGWGDRENILYIYRQQGDTIYDQSTTQIISGWIHNIKAGADIFISKNSTIGLIGTANLNYTTSNTSSRTPISSISNGTIDRILYAKNTAPGDIKNLNFNINYRFADTAGRELNIDLDHGIYRSSKTSYQPNYYKTPSETPWYEKIYSNNTPTDVSINTIKFDYETGFNKGKLGIGAKYSNVKTENSFDFFDVLNGYAVKNIAVSTDFNFKENINAFYVNYNRIIDTTWTIQAGLRIENTNSNGVLIRANGTSQPTDMAKRSYTDLFPTASIAYNISKDHSLNLAFSRRIDRPAYQDLNPFENKLDELTYLKGNAFLRPEYTSTIDLTHTFKSRYNTAISYSRIKDFIAQIIDTNGTSRYLTPKNLNADVFNINFSIPVQVTSWWNLYVNADVYHNIYKGKLNGGKVIIDLPVTSYSIYTQNTFAMGNGYTGELSGYYSAPSVWSGSFKSKGLGGIDLGIQKILFKGNGSIKFSYTDLLKTMKWRGSSDYSGAYIVASGKWESQQLRMNLTWHFGNKQIKQARQHKTGSEEENKRTESKTGYGGN